LPKDVRELVGTQLQDEALDSDEAETCAFWQLVTSIETDLDETVDRVLRRFNPEDQRLLFWLLVALKFMENLRVATRQQKALAARLSLRLMDRVGGIVQEFSKQFKSVLLEVRQGQLRALEAPTFESGE